MSFQPITQVTFCRTGIDEYNKVWVYGNTGVYHTLTSSGRTVGTMREASFQRADGFNTIRVDSDLIPYYSLMKADTVLYRNEQEEDSFFIVGNIIGVEWINPGCSYVHYKVDYFMTYQPMIDWEKSFAYVLREHVKEDWNASGNPNFSNIGPDEGFNIAADTPCYTWVYDLGSVGTIAIYSPYDSTGKPTFDVKNIGAMPSGLNVFGAGTDAATQFLNSLAENKEASPFNVGSIVAVPAKVVSAITAGSVTQEIQNLPCINEGSKQNPNIPNYRNAKCWSSPFFIIRLMSSEGQTLDFNPQWFGNDRSQYQLMITISGAGGQLGAASAGFNPLNNTYNAKAWEDFRVTITKLPSITWTADGYSEWLSNNGANEFYGALAGVMRGIANTTGGLVSAAGGLASASPPLAIAGAAQVSSGIAESASAVEHAIANVNQARSSGATLQGGGSFSAINDIALGSFGFKVVYYGVQPYVMNCIDQYFDRFGYLQNKLKKIDPMSRPIWAYKKTAECHVASTNGVPFIAERAINNMFNAGVTFWDGAKYIAGRTIGDYSSPEQNKGVV